MSGSSGSSLNFAPTTSSPESTSVQVGAVPASWQAPLHFSNPATGVALNVTSAKAGTLVAQLPFPEHERPASGLVTTPEMRSAGPSPRRRERASSA